MKVEHITLGGSAVIRDTSSVSDAVKRHLSGITGVSEKWEIGYFYTIKKKYNEISKIFAYFLL